MLCNTSNANMALADLVLLIKKDVHETSNLQNVNVTSRVPGRLPELLPAPLNATLKGKKKSNGSFQ